LEPETKPSSRAQNFPWLLALLGIFSVLALFTSKRTIAIDTPNPKDAANNDASDVPPTPSSIETDSIPANYCKYEPGTGENHAPWWEKASAVAQVIIALVTVGLLIANLRQANTTRRQLSDFETAQSAQLIIEDLTVETSDSSKRSRVKFAILNAGETVATSIDLQQDGSGWHITPDGLISIEDLHRIKGIMRPVPPRDGGFSLGPHEKSKTFDFDGPIVDNLIRDRIGNIQVILVGYKDIFHQSKWTADCLMFLYNTREWSIACKE